MSAFSDQAVAYESVPSGGPDSAAAAEYLPDISSDEDFDYDEHLPNPDDLLGDEDFVALLSEAPPAAAATAPLGYSPPPPPSRVILEKGGIVATQPKKFGRRPKLRPNLTNAAVSNAFTLARAAIHEDLWLNARVSFLNDKVC